VNNFFAEKNLIGVEENDENNGAFSFSFEQG
jgi:hypothetical protein